MNHLGDLSYERFLSFLRYIKKNSGLLAAEFMLESLKKGDSLDSLLKKHNGYGYSLKIANLSGAKCKIEFGCQVDMTAGDGGEWTVSFDKDDKVSKCVTDDQWIS